MPILLKNGRVVTADSDAVCDILVEGESIAALGRGLAAPAGAAVIDCTGKIVVPGGIDPHVHLEMPFMGTFSSDTYETGTRTALHCTAAPPRSSISSCKSRAARCGRPWKNGRAAPPATPWATTASAWP